MKVIKDAEKQFFRALTGTNLDDLMPDGHVQLNAEELAAVKKVFEICDKADTLTRKLNHDPDDFNSYGEAANALMSILEDFGIDLTSPASGSTGITKGQ